MTEQVREIRSAVRRKGAERFVLLSLISFAMSVILTRLFLELTGYPQLGNSELHIAHVLWGGLLLFVAALLPLMLANRWAFNASAVLSGLGVGLFIDEVGKFITQSNDYFYPPAAPIIYTFFLLTVLLYMRMRRPPVRSPRAEMYRILEEITEVLDCDLDEVERNRLEARLVHVSSSTEDQNLKRLAMALYNYLEKEQVRMVPIEVTLMQRASQRMNPVLEQWVTRRRLKSFLIVAIGAMGVVALIEFILLLVAIPQPTPAIETFIQPLVTRGELRSAQDALWFLVRVFLEGFTGLMLILSGALMIVGRERAGVQMASIMLVIWLTIINLLVFYFDQFGAVTTATVQFLVLMVISYYRSKYLKISTEQAVQGG
jgi:hypothetical protein